MEESFDPATSSLLCLENNNTCFDDFECSAADGSGISPSWDHKNLNFNDQCLSGDNHHGSEPFMGFVVQSDETVGVMVEREREYLPRDDYLRRLRSGDLDLSGRREALDWIWKVVSMVYWFFSNGVVGFLACFDSWTIHLNQVPLGFHSVKMKNESTSRFFFLD